MPLEASSVISSKFLLSTSLTISYLEKIILIGRTVLFYYLIRSYKPITEELGENVLPQVIFASSLFLKNTI